MATNLSNPKRDIKVGKLETMERTHTRTTIMEIRVYLFGITIGGNLQETMDNYLFFTLNFWGGGSGFRARRSLQFWEKQNDKAIVQFAK